MIKFTKIEIKNLMSVGNKPIVIDLDSHKKTLIVGKNGTGKSTILVEALTFGLYGKPYRDINKPQLVNSTNKKGLEVNLHFEVGGNLYHVKRGIGPAVFQISKNGTLIDEDASTGDYQIFLEKTILNMSLKTFKQLVVLGTAGFTPFMQLKPADRRVVVDDLIDTHVFGLMQSANKEAAATVGSDIVHTEHSIDLVNQKKSMLERQSAESKEQTDAQIERLRDKIADWNQKIGSCTANIAMHDATLAKLQAALSDGKHAAILPKLYDKRGQLQAKVSDNQRMMKFLSENETCPVCTQSIDQTFRDNKVFSLDMDNDQTNSNIRVLAENIETNEKTATRDKTVQQRIDETKRARSGEVTSMMNYQRSVADAEEEIEFLSQKVYKSYDKELDAIGKKIDALSDQRLELLNDKYCHSVVTQMLKDSGIKSVVIGQYIPVINGLIQKYLTDFGAVFNFELDSEFNEIVKTRGMENFSYNSFSQGQKFRIDLAVLFAWRELIQQRTGAMINIMVMDEVMDSASDTDGIEALVEILDRIKESVYIISHNEKLDAMDFDRRIDVRLVGRFSEIEITV